MAAVANLRSLNLNHLPVLREVLRQRSISKAAATLNLTQPAVSNTIRILRDHFADELLVRNGNGFELTAKSKQLLQSLEVALQHIELSIGGGEFDLGSAARTVRIATVDNVIAAIAGPLARLCADEAPNVEIELLLASRDLAKELQSGAIEIAITSETMMRSLQIGESARRELRSEVLADERLMGIGPSGDASLSAGLTLDEYLKRKHASYIVDSEQHYTVEREWREQHGLKSNSLVRTASNLSLLDIVATTGCIALVPETLARKAIALYPIQMFEPPMPLPDIRWVMVRHQRSEIDAIVRWAMDAVVRSADVFVPLR